MSFTANTAQPLPQEMQQHTYAIMREEEGRHWWFIGRRKIIESFLERIGERGELKNILDVGCGTGANLEILSRYGEAEGVDVSAEALSFCRARGLNQVRQGEAEHLPYEDNSFDLVTALDVVEHLDDDIGGLREMRRVLRPGGRALFFVPAFMFLWGVQDDVSNHRRRYRLAEIKDVARRAGFEIERASYANMTFFAPTLLGRWLMRLIGFRPTSESKININALNGLFGRILGAESSILRHMNLPFGVSAICVARRVD